MSSGGHTTVECRYKGLLEEEEQYPYSRLFMDVLGVARHFKGSKKSGDKDKIARAEEVRLHLRHTFLYHLGYVA